MNIIKEHKNSDPKMNLIKKHKNSDPKNENDKGNQKL